MEKKNIFGVYQKKQKHLVNQHYLFRKEKMKNKDFDSFNNDRILAARKRVIDLLYLIGSWEEQRKSTKTND